MTVTSSPINWRLLDKSDMPVIYLRNDWKEKGKRVCEAL